MRAAALIISATVLVSIVTAANDFVLPSYQNERPSQYGTTELHDVSTTPSLRGLCSPAALIAYVVVAIITGSIHLTLKQDALTCAHYVGNEGINVESHLLKQKPFGLTKTWSLTKDGEEVARYVQNNFLFEEYTIQKRVDDEWVPVGSLTKKYFVWDTSLDYDCHWSGGESGDIKFTFWDHRAKLTRGDETLIAQENYYDRAFSIFRNPQLTLRDPTNKITTVIVKKAFKWTNTFEICTAAAGNAESLDISNNVIDMGAVALPFQAILDAEAESESKDSSSKSHN